MDKLIINARERPYSPDIMDMQAMVSRAFSDFMRYRYSEGFNANSAVANQKVCYGLTVTSSPGTTVTDVVMTPGVLMQLSTTIVPAPGPLDSPFRIGINRNSVTVPLPNPGSATWYTLEAQVTEAVATTEVRDILNAITGQFAAQTVSKRVEWSCGTVLATGGLNWRTGTAANIPVPTGGDWVTLASFLVQPGGTILAAADAVDMRPVAKLRTSETRQGWSRTPSVPVLRTVAKPSATPANVASFAIRLAVEKATTNADNSADQGGGLDLSVSDSTASLNSFVATAPAVIQPAYVTVASTWAYLYLCPFYNVAPEQQRQGPSHTRGVLVLSPTPPDDEGLFNSLPIVLPQPFSNYTVPAYQAPCVGALRVNAANDGFSPMDGGSNTFVMVPYSTFNSCSLVTAMTTTAIDPALIPVNAKVLHWLFLVTMTGAGAELDGVGVGDTGSVLATQWANAIHALGSGDPQQYAVELRAPRRHSEQLLFTQYTLTRAFSSITALLVGYTT